MHFWNSDLMYSFIGLMVIVGLFAAYLSPSVTGYSVASKSSGSEKIIFPGLASEFGDVRPDNSTQTGLEHLNNFLAEVSPS